MRLKNGQIPPKSLTYPLGEVIFEKRNPSFIINDGLVFHITVTPNSNKNCTLCFLTNFQSVGQTVPHTRYGGQPSGVERRSNCTVTSQDFLPMVLLMGESTDHDCWVKKQSV